VVPMKLAGVDATLAGAVSEKLVFRFAPTDGEEGAVAGGPRWRRDSLRQVADLNPGG